MSGVGGAVPCRGAGDVQAQQVIVVTQFESVGTTFQLPTERSDRFEPPTWSLEVDHCCAGGILGLHGEFGNLERRVYSPALYEEWAAWHE